MRKFFLSLSLVIANTAFSITTQNVAIIGGENTPSDGPAYASLITLNGQFVPLSGVGFPSSVGDIMSVAINSSGIGIIGGQDLSGTQPAYAALVSTSGQLMQLSSLGFPSTFGKIVSVAINDSGIGIIGGQDLSGPEPAYAALVSPTGQLSNLSGGGFPSNGAILSVGIGSSGIGIIGGQDLSGAQPPYAAFVSPTGQLTQITGSSFPTTGFLNSVAINDSGFGIIGGRDNTGTFPAYAALVSPNGDLTRLSGEGFPSIKGRINSVAINKSGAGIIGGQDLSGDQPAYAALVSPNGQLTQLRGSTFPAPVGRIVSVAINNSGFGIIGGSEFSDPQPAFAALVNPNGQLTILSGDGFPSTSGSIKSVAISESGVGLIGGQDLTGTEPAYLAIVAPNGHLTQLSGKGFPSSSGVILSVALKDIIKPKVESITPKAIGPFNSVFNGFFASTFALTGHTEMHHKKLWENKQGVLLADNSDLMALNNKKQLNVDKKSTQKVPDCESHHSLWFTPFYDYVHQSSSGIVPAINNEIGGALLGYDYQCSKGITLGGAFSYAFTYADYAKRLGHTKINQEMGVVYASFSTELVFINLALWGGGYQFTNKRHTLGFINSEGKSHGWLLSPHAEFSIHKRFYNWLTVEPFGMLDWANNWQDKFTEKGVSGLNLTVPSIHNSVLRSEVGLRTYQALCYSRGRFIIEEKLSYINQAPFGTKSTTAFFVGSPSGFSVTTASSKTVNLAGVELNLAFIANNPKGFYGSLDFQGEFGSSFQSYFVSLEGGKRF